MTINQIIKIAEENRKNKSFKSDKLMQDWDKKKLLLDTKKKSTKKKSK